MIKNKFISSILSAVLCVGVTLPSTNASGEIKFFLGDANMDSVVDSSDASLILSEYSTVSTGGAVTFSSLQKQCADVDENSIIDASDASYVLAYYAYISTGGTAEFIDFINDENEYDEAEYKLENIDISADVFRWHARNLNNEILANKIIGTSYTEYTGGGYEAEFLLAMLNEGYISNDALVEVFNNRTYEDMKNYTEFIYSIVDIQEMVGTGKIDYKKYTLNDEIGEYINLMDDAYRNGKIEEFIKNEFMDCNMPKEYYYNSAIMSMMCSYDKNNMYLYDFNADDLCVNDFINNLCDIIEQRKSET